MAKGKPFDAAEYLDSPEMIAAYLNEALESEDASAIAVAIGTVARARGMSAVAEKAGLSRENLYRALGGEAKPEFGTVIKVLHALGIDFICEAEGGRERGTRFGPRTLDLDLIWYDGRQLESDRLTLPHPRAHEREFVLRPLADVAPGIDLHGETVAALLERLPPQGVRATGAPLM